MGYDSDEWTTISLKRKTKDDLASLGIFGESFDNLIEKIVKKVK